MNGEKSEKQRKKKGGEGKGTGALGGASWHYWRWPAASIGYGPPWVCAHGQACSRGGQGKAPGASTIQGSSASATVFCQAETTGWHGKWMRMTVFAEPLPLRSGGASRSEPQPALTATTRQG